MENYSLNQIIEIYWVDIQHENKWLKEEEAQKFPLPECYTVGYFLNQDEDVVRISPFLGIDKERDVAIFPRGVIKEIKVIRD